MSIIDAIDQHLADMGLRYRRLDDERIEIGFTGKNTQYSILIVSQGPWATFVTPALLQVPERRFDEMLRLANLINARRLRWGAVWVNPDYHTLGFELLLPLPELPTQEQVRIALSAVHVVDELHPAFMRLLWGGEAAEAAFDSLSQPPAADGGPSDLDLAV